MAVLRVPAMFESINAAIEAANEGDTILVANGIYRESVVVNRNFVRVIADGNRVILSGSGRLGFGFAVSGVRGVEIEGFKIRDYTIVGISVTGPFCRVARNQVRDIRRGTGVLVLAEGNLVWRNKVCGVRGPGILVLDSDAPWLIENRICHSDAEGIRVLGGRGPGIIKNHTERNGTFGIVSSSANALVLGNKLILNGDEPSQPDAAVREALIQESSAVSPVDGTGVVAELLQRLQAIADQVPTEPGNAVIISNRFIENETAGVILLRNNGFAAANDAAENAAGGIIVGASAQFSIVQENRITLNNGSGLVLDGSDTLALRNRLCDNRPFDLVLVNSDSDVVENQCERSSPTGLCNDDC